MRELEFRVWDYATKKFIFDQYIVLGNMASYSGAKVPNWIIEQFIGLLDKNGRKIFNGDIVKCKYGHIGQVTWEEHDVCFNVTEYYSSSDDHPTMAFFEGGPFEVIGNIHENPELLNPPDDVSFCDKAADL